MPYRRRFYENLPLYARLIDEEKGLLRFFCDAAIQPELDILRRIIEEQEYFYDTRHPVSWNHLDWLGQFVGLGIIGTHWLGVGLNPDWDVPTKIDVIERAIPYWKIKGSRAGIIEAISMWLRVDKRNLVLNTPFGDDSGTAFRNWWNSETAYDASLNQNYPEKQMFGWGNYWGQRYRADYHSIQPPAWKWDYLEPWSDWMWETIPHHEGINERSRLGDRELWMHFYLKELQWNTVFPNIFELNFEILPVTTTATIFGWIELNKESPNIVLFKDEKYLEDTTFLEVELDGVHYGQLVSVGNLLCPIPTLPWNQEPYLYGGTLFPGLPLPTYTTQEEQIIELEWGVWEPDYWNGMWWGSVLDEAAVETLDALVADADLPPVETFTVPWELLFSLLGLKQVLMVPAEFWYVAWGIHQSKENVSVVHNPITCTTGIPFHLGDAHELTIDLGNQIYEFTNLLLAPTGNDYVITSGNAATHLTMYGQGNEFFYNYGKKPFFEDVLGLNDPMATFSIALNYAPLPTWFFAIYDAYFCNIFGRYSTLTQLKTIKHVSEEKPEDKYSWVDIYPVLKQASCGDNWVVLLETVEEVFFLKPVTMYWFVEGNEKLRSQSFSFDDGFNNLYLEFVFKPKLSTQINYVALSLCNKVIQHQGFYYKLDIQNEGYVGLSFKIPFCFPTGVRTPKQERLLEEILPLLTQEIRALSGLPLSEILLDKHGFPMAQPILQPVPQSESLLQVLQSMRDLLANTRGDKHITYTIQNPIYEIKIVHNLGKYPSVSFVDTTNSAGRFSQATIDYLDLNTVNLRFSELTTGRVFFN